MPGAEHSDWTLGFGACGRRLSSKRRGRDSLTACLLPFRACSNCMNNRLFRRSVNPRQTRLRNGAGISTPQNRHKFSIGSCRFCGRVNRGADWFSTKSDADPVNRKRRGRWPPGVRRFPPLPRGFCGDTATGARPLFSSEIFRVSSATPRVSTAPRMSGPKLSDSLVNTERFTGVSLRRERGRPHADANDGGASRSTRPSIRPWRSPSSAQTLLKCFCGVCGQGLHLLPLCYQPLDSRPQIALKTITPAVEFTSDEFHGFATKTSPSMTV
jgi:hypothetical protein